MLISLILCCDTTVLPDIRRLRSRTARADCFVVAPALRDECSKDKRFDAQINQIDAKIMLERVSSTCTNACNEAIEAPVAETQAQWNMPTHSGRATILTTRRKEPKPRL